jgi:rhamnosyltransferase
MRYMQNKTMTPAKSICAVVTTYHPGPEFGVNIALLRSQVDDVIVVDDGSSPQSLARTQEICRKNGVTLLANASNLGIATALNVGCSAAVERGFEWVATFDQDSSITPNFISSMLDVGCSSTLIGIVAPQYVDRASGEAMPQHDVDQQEVMATMTSGSMLRLSAYRKAGPFRNDFVIDFVDHEYCLRLRSVGLRIVKAPNACLIHSLGRTRYHGFGRRRVVVTHHSATRRYYITRNRLCVLWRYRREYGWLLLDLRAFLMETIKIVLYEEHKLQKLRATILGLVDFARGKMGQRMMS